MAVHAAVVAAEVGAMIRLGRASFLPSTVTVSETMVVAVLASPSSRVLETCQVGTPGSGLVNSVTVPSVSDRVKEPVTLPVRVRSSAPGSGIHPFFAAFAVKNSSSPSASTTVTAVSETLWSWT